MKRETQQKIEFASGCTTGLLLVGLGFFPSPFKDNAYTAYAKSVDDALGRILKKAFGRDVAPFGVVEDAVSEAVCALGVWTVGNTVGRGVAHWATSRFVEKDETPAVQSR